MTELTFTKTFLSTLDARPLKLQSDYSLPPKDLVINGAYTLPKMPNAMRKPSSQKGGDIDSPQKLTVTLTSSRNPVLELTVPEIDPAVTTVLDLKERVAKHLGLDGVGKVKILWEKKPVADVKTVKEIEGDKGGKVEFGVMVMGYKAPSAAQKGDGELGEGDKMDLDAETLDEAFWADVRGFLQQRLKDEGKAEEVFKAFQAGWEKR